MQTLDAGLSCKWYFFLCIAYLHERVSPNMAVCWVTIVLTQHSALCVYPDNFVMDTRRTDLHLQYLFCCLHRECQGIAGLCDICWWKQRCIIYPCAASRSPAHRSKRYVLPVFFWSMKWSASASRRRHWGLQHYLKPGNNTLDAE
jgi:hypothetical protein